MRSLFASSALLLVILVGSAITASSQTPPSTRPAVATPQTAPTPSPVAAGQVARGEYLVHRVAMCVQCHSPRDLRGDLIPQEQLRGASLPVGRPSWASVWALRTPALAGLPGFTDEQIVMLLTEGRAGDRPPPMPPMPPFRMTKDDAAAVVAYLRSR
jgi:mono/diheme cytochrome c family protein